MEIRDDHVDEQSRRLYGSKMKMGRQTICARMYWRRGGSHLRPGGDAT
jgi:hypothetical protein